MEGVPPIMVFTSHKGGVGRSTALGVSAAALSAEGFNVLLIDLDMEAPGLGEMLLKEAPKFGRLDYFVEDGLSELDDSFFEDLVIPSQLTTSGLVHVVPVIGEAGNANPQNVLGKLARAYLEKARDDATVESFLDRTRKLVRRLAERTRYDAIFIDARAGLTEATAAAVLGLGADVLLFGVDTPQTFAGYRYFLSHLERFRPSASSESDWRYRLRMVHAKAQADPAAQARFRTEAFELFSDTLYDIEETMEEEAFNFDYDDVTAPHYAWPILNDLNYSEFNPLAHND
jgi:CobQ/CobB/MinD/ParA nucleotide binding domain